MKFIYKLQHKKIPKKRPGLSSVFSMAQMSEQAGIPLDDPFFEDEFIDIVVGGYFFPEDGKTSINLTSEHLIRNNKDNIHANNLYLQSFLPGDLSNILQSTNTNYPDSNYIGKWSDEIDANAIIYYVIVNNKIKKIIFSKPIEFGTHTDIFGVVNIIEDEGNMVYCTPDEGDVLFDNEKEAKQYIKEYNEIFSPINKKNRI